MKKPNSLLCIGLGCLGLLTIVGWLNGCAAPEVAVEPAAPVFFPSPPELPRLQFLKSFSTADDLGGAKPSAFETFLLGPAKAQSGIATPFGVVMYDGKLYVCDVGQRKIQVVDLVHKTITPMTNDARLRNPVNIYITADGVKYVADPAAGAVLVFDRDNKLLSLLGKAAQIQPLDVVVNGNRCYVTDFASNQVVVLDTHSGAEIQRIGSAGDNNDQFRMISDLALSPSGHLLVTDKLKAQILEFDQKGTYVKTLGHLGDNIDELARPKGIAVDHENRIWVVDSAAEVAKIYDDQGRLLLYFGLPGNEPGKMSLPAQITLDYNAKHIDAFRSYAVPGARIDCLVLVTNQYGPNKVSVYGFGTFPMNGQPVEPAVEPEEQVQPPTPPVEATPTPVTPAPATLPSNTQSATTTPAPVQPEPTPSQPTQDAQAAQQQEQQRIANLYYRSLALYRAGRYSEARPGFVEVSQSPLIPPAMKASLERTIRQIDQRLSQSGQGR